MKIKNLTVFWIVSISSVFVASAINLKSIAYGKGFEKDGQRISRSVIHKGNQIHEDNQIPEGNNSPIQDLDSLSATVALIIGNEKSGAKAKGTLQLTQENPDGPVHITGTLTNLRPKGNHGFHVHQSSDFSQGCTSTGGHFNPKGVNHGAPEDEIRHVGDLGNIIADENGVANVEITDSVISLNGPNSIIGKAFVVHEKTDDMGTGGDDGSMKTGNAGSRLVCGKIVKA